jgi:hypothetical protein
MFSLVPKKRAARAAMVTKKTKQVKQADLVIFLDVRDVPHLSNRAKKPPKRCFGLIIFFLK